MVTLFKGAVARQSSLVKFLRCSTQIISQEVFSEKDEMQVWGKKGSLSFETRRPPVLTMKYCAS